QIYPLQLSGERMTSLPSNHVDNVHRDIPTHSLVCAGRIRVQAIRPRVSADRYSLSAGFPPRFQPALDVPAAGKAHLLRSLHCHGGAFAERTVEQQTISGGKAKLMEQAARPDVVGQVVIRRMERAGNDAMSFPFAPFTKIDQHDTPLSNQ